MALSLLQKYNIRQGLGLDDAVLCNKKIDEGVRQLSADILRGTVTISDSLIAPSACTQAQLNGAAERGIRGALYASMISSITSDAAFESAGVNVTDSQITNAVKRQIGFFAKWIGTVL